MENLAGSPPGISQVIKRLPDCLSINSYQDDGYELVDKNSLRIGMMGDCQVFMLIKFTKSTLRGVVPYITVNKLI